MKTFELIQECKKGLGISQDNSSMDGLLEQKIKVIQSYMRNAGVLEEKLTSELAVGIIVMGVADIWELQGGAVKFSPAFNILLSQLTYDKEVSS